MGFVHTYAPDAWALAGAAQQTGLGRLAQRKSDRDRQIEQADREFALRRDQVAFNQQLAEAQFAADQLQRQRSAAAANRELQSRLAQQQQQYQATLQGNLLNQQTELAKYGMQLDAQQAQNQSAWAGNSVAAMEKQINADMAAIMKEKLDPEGQRLLGEMSSSLRAIRAQRPNLFPEEYAGLLSSWYEKLGEHGLENRIIKPPTGPEMWQQNVVDLGGGRFVYVNPNTGEARPIDPPKPEKPEKPEKPDLPPIPSYESIRKQAHAEVLSELPSGEDGKQKIPPDFLQRVDQRAAAIAAHARAMRDTYGGQAQGGLPGGEGNFPADLPPNGVLVSPKDQAVYIDDASADPQQVQELIAAASRGARFIMRNVDGSVTEFVKP